MARLTNHFKGIRLTVHIERGMKELYVHLYAFQSL